MALLQLKDSEANKNFGLTSDEFQEMVCLLKKGDDSLFRHIFLQHFQACLLYLKRECNASHTDAYDTTMETLVEFHKRLKGDKISYGNIRFLFTRMATQVYFKWIKKENKKESLEGIDLIEESTRPDEETLTILSKAWNKLGDNCREILQAFYYQQINLKEMAEQAGKSHAALRKQKERCVIQLRSNFKRWYVEY